LAGREGGGLYWVSVAQLATDAVALASKLPPGVTGVVGLPRSGMIPASVIATLLHLPLYELDNAGRLNRLGNGSRGTLLPFTPADGGREAAPEYFAVIDDTVYSGAAMRRARDAMNRLKHEAVYAAVYSRLQAVPGSENAADIYGRALPTPHLLEWNVANSGTFVGICGDVGLPYYKAGVAVDLDGIVLHDAESGGEVGKPYMVPRSVSCKLICTGRPQRHRKATEAQLARHGALWDRLEMLPDDAPETPQAIAAHKARHYAESGCGFFFESDPLQAELIHHLCGKPVVCPRAGRVWHGGDPAVAPEPLLPDSAVAAIFAPLAGKKVALVHSPQTGNTGDRLIERAAEQLLDRFGVPYEVREPDEPGDCDTILLFGGGNFGHHLCPVEAARRARALATGKPCVLLPQTAYGPEPSDREYAAAFVRDARSLALVPGSTLAPDLALCYRPERPLPPP
jgi:hypothetical protein